jgi:hypothetical protein
MLWKFKWGVLYLFLLLAVYPCIYDWFLADDFYHYTSKYEPHLIQDQKRLQQTLQQTIKSNVDANFGRLVLNREGAFEFKNWLLTRDPHLSLSALSVNDDPIDARVSFRCSFTVTSILDREQSVRPR